MTPLYSKIEPYEHGMLDVGGGHQIYWEVCGNPKGKPALVLHGGPGAGCTADARRFFRPKAYRIVLFDQRGCGRSTPHASDPNTDLSTNTTHHLLADIEALRRHLDIDRWLVFGSSWGATLALAYTEQNPQRVPALVLASVTTTRPADIDWVYRGVGRLFPKAWAAFQAGSGLADPDADIIEAYSQLLENPDPARRDEAARDWCAWEAAVISVDPKQEPHPRYSDPKFRVAFARLATHYYRHNAWLEDGALLRDAHFLGGIPGVMVHGRLDLATPIDTPWQLSQLWRESELIVVQEAGHEFRTAGMLQSLVSATDRFA